MGKEDNVDVDVNVDKEEMPKIRNHEAKTIIMGQCIADIIRDLDILNLIIGKKVDEQANTTEVVGVNLFLLNTNSLAYSNNIWFLDCACTNHMSHDRKLFRSIEISNTNEVRIGHGKISKIEGIRTIKIQTRSNYNKVFKDFYYVTNFIHSLLSLGQLMEWDIHLIFMMINTLLCTRRDICLQYLFRWLVEGCLQLILFIYLNLL